VIRHLPAVLLTLLVSVSCYDTQLKTDGELIRTNRLTGRTETLVLDVDGRWVTMPVLLHRQRIRAEKRDSIEAVAVAPVRAYVLNQRSRGELSEEAIAYNARLFYGDELYNRYLERYGAADERRRRDTTR
jgi:hypothetical protein